MSYLLKSKQDGFASPRPGDAVVSKDLRTVYLIAPDGSWRRCRDAAAVKTAVDLVKKKLEGQVREGTEGERLLPGGRDAES